MVRVSSFPTQNLYSYCQFLLLLLSILRVSEILTIKSNTTETAVTRIQCNTKNKLQQGNMPEPAALHQKIDSNKY